MAYSQPLRTMTCQNLLGSTNAFTTYYALPTFPLSRNLPLITHDQSSIPTLSRMGDYSHFLTIYLSITILPKSELGSLGGWPFAHISLHHRFRGSWEEQCHGCRRLTTSCVDGEKRETTDCSGRTLGLASYLSTFHTELEGFRVHFRHAEKEDQSFRTFRHLIFFWGLNTTPLLSIVALDI